MSGCVLRVQEEGVNVKELLSSPVFLGAAQFNDGFNFTISEKEIFNEQAIETEKFLIEHKKELKSLKEQLKTTTPQLDFGIFKNENYSQSYAFKTSIVKLAGELGFGLRLSIYEENGL